MDLGPVPNWTLVEYCHECAGLMAVKWVEALAADDQNLVVYDRNCFGRGTVLGT